jgi:hypothetical protein
MRFVESHGKARGFLLPGQNVKNFMVSGNDIRDNLPELLIHQ